MRRPRELGYPVLLKAIAGGGGKGMRLVEDEADLEAAFATGAGEAESAFGDGGVYLEKALVPARHVEVQVLAGPGRRRPHARRARVLDPAAPPEARRGVAVARARRRAREAMEAAAERAVRAIGYTNAGTFEFLLGPDGGFHFIELNCRLQVEHPVSELVTGIDLVYEQLRIAAGRPARR